MSELNPVENTAGFSRPQSPIDGYAAGLYDEYGLSPTPSMADIEPIAKDLLSDVTTVLDGMSLVLGRRVDAQELTADPKLGMVMMMGEPGTKFGILLLMRSFSSSTEDEL